MKPFTKPLYTDEEWTPGLLTRMLEISEEITTKEYGLSIHPNELKIVTPKQMEDAMVTGALPLQIHHWYYGLLSYRAAAQGTENYLEVVQNTFPVQSYCVENNTATEMLTIIAHAACGHNTVYKNNFLFSKYSSSKGIVDYLIFARQFLRKCEEKYGEDRVADLLTACMTLQSYSVDLGRKPKLRSYDEELVRLQARVQRFEETYNPVFHDRSAHPLIGGSEPKMKFPLSPDENVLKFIEKHGPRLNVIEQWEAEVVRIIRMINAYFYPHRRTRVIHEGVACTMQWKIMNRLSPLDLGALTNKAMNYFFETHNSVIAQGGYGRNRDKFDGNFYPWRINHYSLGFRLFEDIERMCKNPTDEDRQWFPKLAGADFWEVFRHIVAEHDDETFIRTYLSPKLIRDYGFLALLDDPDDDHYEVTHIHNEEGYRHIRDKLASQWCYHDQVPNIMVEDVDVSGGAVLTLRHQQYEGMKLSERSVGKVLMHVNRHLWPRVVRLKSVDGEGQCSDLWLIDGDDISHYNGDPLEGEE